MGEMSHEHRVERTVVLVLWLDSWPGKHLTDIAAVQSSWGESGFRKPLIFLPELLVDYWGKLT